MIAVYVTLGILVGFIMAVVITWALLRQLEDKDEGKKDKEKEKG